MNVVYSSDDNYAQHLGASISSLLMHNNNVDEVNIFVVDNEISEENKRRIEEIVSPYACCSLTWISFEKWKEKLHLNMPWPIALSSYARLFVGSMLPADIERILYLDADTIICSDLHELWNAQLEEMVLGAVQDCVGDRVKVVIGMECNEKYINAGVMLIDLKKWRRLNVEQRCLDFIAEKQGEVIHHDQGVLNGVLRKQIKILPLVNNVMTIHYVFSLRKIRKYFGDNSEFYDEREIKEAKSNPVILHFTPSFTSHPWEKGCCHPYATLYWKALENTPWANAELQKRGAKWYVNLYEWRYRTLPF